MNLTQQAFADPTGPALTAAQYTEIATFAHGPRTPYERSEPIHVLFERQVERTPDADAIIDANGSISYAEVDRRANRLARHLGSLGAQAGMSIGVAFERSRDLPIALLAILKTGSAYVPIDLSYPVERIEFILADASVALVIVANTAAGSPALEQARVVSLSAAATAIQELSSAPLTAAITSEAPAYIMYTSGSTGRAKGVVIPHRGVVRLVRGADYFTVGADETFLAFAPASFDASTFEIWAALLNGARLAIPSPGLLSIEDLGATIARLRVTTMWLTASLFQRVVEAQLPTFAALRQMLTGGSAGSPRHMIRFLDLYPECRLIAGYGPTENTTFSTTYDLSSPAAIGSNPPIGHPIANSSAFVVDEQLRPVPLGVSGELCVGGDGVGLGYRNLPNITAERFVADPFSNSPGAKLYRTGDTARMRADGVIEFLGRSDDQVKINGFRIELGEIEAVLRAHTGIRDAALLALEGEPGDKRLSAYVVAAAGITLDEPSLRAYLRSKLPQYMMPHEIEVRDELPLHPSGKIDRVALAAASLRAPRQPVAQLAGPAQVASRPLTKPLISRAVVAIWRETLGLNHPPDLHVNFFDAGGDSIRLLRLHSLLNERLDANVTVLDLFEHTTVARIVDLIVAGAR